MMSFQESLDKFTITCEMGPLKGCDTHEIVEVAHLLKGKVHAANVTDQQSSVLRLGPLVTSHLLQENGLEAVLQMTNRDRNRIAIQSDLLSAAALGINNVLSLTGDYQSLGDHPHAKGVFDLDSVQFLATVKTLNDGKDLSGLELTGVPNFCAGAVVNPGADTEASYELQIIKMEKKAELGARFFQTQAVYDFDVFEKFMKRVSHINVPVLVGIIPLKNAGMAKYMNKFVSGVFVPEHYIERMAKAENKEQEGIKIAAELIKGLKDMCQGVHVMAIGWEKAVPEILAESGLL
ncbi:methylenetetrahydrofolate reductase [Candidatus Contubernalis alkaliaceticus]|uniref:methylenetetrahydrofolate reductase n=1 Tax=Candidatus Contubernalis alkaliaceticus TaxID=338645 RepID=UPI001F4C4167|nr:methylenetetrahydrofolate reductase [Candidatus Contubernalis alkalaceticus]UNC92286.1 methylenetetrahydrofolate reductase [Candidatus Contubernalis alkalaceticus]